MRTFVRLVYAEWVKTMSMLSTYIAFAAVGMFVLLLHVGVLYGGSSSDIYKYLVQYNIPTHLLINPFATTRVGLQVGFVVLIAPMVIQTFARQVSGEDSRGTLRLILSRPISRFSLLNAKFIVCIVYSLMLMGAFLGGSYGIGLLAYGYSDSLTVGKPSELRDDKFRDPELAKEQESQRAKLKDMKEDERKVWEGILRNQMRKRSDERRAEALMKNFVLKKDKQIPRMFIALGLTTWALLTIGSLAFFFSVINKHPIAAMGATIGTYFLVVILYALSDSDALIPLFKAIRPYLFVHGMDYWQGCFSQEIDWRKIWGDFALLGAYTVAFFGAAQYLFWRKDITS